MANMDNTIILTGDFNIRDSNWDPNFQYHSIPTKDLITIADSLGLELFLPSNPNPTRFTDNPRDAERGKRDVDCDKQIVKAVTALNCMLKGSWEERGSGGIKKKLKSEYAAYLESKYRRNDGSSI